MVPACLVSLTKWYIQPTFGDLLNDTSIIISIVTLTIH